MSDGEDGGDSVEEDEEADERESGKFQERSRCHRTTSPTSFPPAAHASSLARPSVFSTPSTTATMKFLAGLALASAVAGVVGQNFMINTPSNVVVCEPILFTWTGGTPPYYLSILPGGQPSAPALVNLGEQQGTSYTWTVTQPAGTSLGLTLRDSSGQTVQSAPFTVLSGTDTSCLNGSSGASSATSSGSSSSSATSSSGTATSGSSTSAASGSTTATGTTTGSAATHSTTSPSGSRSTGSSTSSAPATTTSNSSASAARVAQIGVAGLAGALVAAIVA
ncbi:hypothetical protein GLOTRDRAFT_130486 [Gloeophyllum trabeum ATCC 11539]|uniref:Uncharacterized protein n=1 Tax=Gloeophyllum trabeum (strain ATCC 11539 / FP-39264 / Madison 617) TaxID=670483 RepID=S7Q4G8_GLOTA|nr:uncharacterized protein GLOTRDRAFT_130486 [Gloeophyllum trabeum ATCC 11539]EPQ54378.1 hypothetical protein GLOTRDRAFT_130486 [Gloeophyllum trabeum ATCC 11539]